jgi:hypothetical protein
MFADDIVWGNGSAYRNAQQSENVFVQGKLFICKFVFVQVVFPELARCCPVVHVCVCKKTF